MSDVAPPAASALRLIRCAAVVAPPPSRRRARAQYSRSVLARLAASAIVHILVVTPFEHRHRLVSRVRVRVLKRQHELASHLSKASVDFTVLVESAARERHDQLLRWYDFERGGSAAVVGSVRTLGTVRVGMFGHGGTGPTTSSSMQYAT